MAKKNETKVAAPKAAKTGGAPKKEGLRKPQLRILAALQTNGGRMTRTEIADKAPVDVAMCTEYLGSDDETKRKQNDAKHFPSLLTLGLIKAFPPAVVEEAGRQGSTYQITAAGKTALVKADKQAKS